MLVLRMVSPFSALQGGLPLPLLAAMAPSANAAGREIGCQTRRNDVISASPRQCLWDAGSETK
jgi:hypothetical protein